MGYDTYWSEDSADLRHLTNDAWRALTASLLEHLPDETEAFETAPHHGEDLTYGSPFFRWMVDATGDPTQRLIFFGESEARIDHDDVLFGFTLIAPHLAPSTMLLTSWDGDDSDDEGQVRVYGPSDMYPTGGVVYAPVEKSYPPASAHVGGDAAAFLAERERREDARVKADAEYREGRAAEHAKEHTAADVLGLDGWAEHLAGAHYHGERVKPSEIMATHERVHADQAPYQAWGPADAGVFDPARV